jgi:hypothetical protein
MFENRGGIRKIRDKFKNRSASAIRPWERKTIGDAHCKDNCGITTAEQGKNRRACPNHTAMQIGFPMRLFQQN